MNRLQSNPLYFTPNPVYFTHFSSPTFLPVQCSVCKMSRIIAPFGLLLYCILLLWFKFSSLSSLRCAIKRIWLYEKYSRQGQFPRYTRVPDITEHLNLAFVSWFHISFVCSIYLFANFDNLQNKIPGHWPPLKKLNTGFKTDSDSLHWGQTLPEYLPLL